MKLKIFFTNNSYAAVNLPNAVGDINTTTNLIIEKLKNSNGDAVVLGNCVIASANLINNILIVDDKKKQHYANDGFRKD